MRPQQRKPHIHKKNDERDWGLLFLVLAIFLFVGALFVEGERGSNEQSSVLLPNNPDLYQNQRRQMLKQLDRDLKDSAMKDELYRAAIQNENESAGRVDEEGEISNSERLEDVNPLVFEQENPGENILSDTEGTPPRLKRKQTPEQRIAAKLARDQWIQDYQKRQKAEFVKQFLENAHRNGIDLRLNENLDVTGIDRFEVEKPIRIPQSQSNK